MGSATFALPSLIHLFERGYDIRGVITQPDKPGGRGQNLQSSPVKKRAHELHLPIYQLSSLKTDEAHALMVSLESDLIVVVAYGKLLPGWLLHLPRYGCINLHGSLLPRYRGAAPVHWAVANGETVTGVSTMLLDEGMDTGGVFLCEEASIGPDETISELYERLSAIGGALMVRTLEGILKGDLKPTPQDHSKATLAPILKKEDGFIDWSMKAEQIHNRVRAFNPWPGTVTKLRGKVCKILKTRIVFSSGGEVPERAGAGRILSTRQSLHVVCGDGNFLEILSIQPENRKAVSGADFANGARIQPDEKFEPMG